MTEQQSEYQQFNPETPPKMAAMLRERSLQQSEQPAWKKWAIRAGGVVGAGLAAVFVYKWLLAHGAGQALGLVGGAGAAPFAYKVHEFIGGKVISS